MSVCVCLCVSITLPNLLTHCVFLANGQQLLVLHTTGHLVLWDLKERRVYARYATMDLEVRKNGSEYVCVCECVWVSVCVCVCVRTPVHSIQMPSFPLLLSPSALQHKVTAIHWSKSGQTFIAGHDDGHISV